jgi:hypothetical protein
MYKRHYVSIDDAIIDLQARGFSNDFCLLEEQLFCMQQNRALRNSEFNILETWYFPKGKLISQDMMLYGIECPDHYLKGILHITAKQHVSVMPEILHRKLTEELLKYRYADRQAML